MQSLLLVPNLKAPSDKETIVLPIGQSVSDGQCKLRSKILRNHQVRLSPTQEDKKSKQKSKFKKK